MLKNPWPKNVYFRRWKHTLLPEPLRNTAFALVFSRKPLANKGAVTLINERVTLDTSKQAWSSRNIWNMMPWLDATTLATLRKELFKIIYV